MIATATPSTAPDPTQWHLPIHRPAAGPIGKGKCEVCGCPIAWLPYPKKIHRAVRDGAETHWQYRPRGRSLRAILPTGKIQREGLDPDQVARRRFEAAAPLALAGVPLATIARKMGVEPDTLRHTVRTFPVQWQQALDRARQQLQALPPPDPPREHKPAVPAESRQQIADIVAAMAAGLTRAEVTGRLDLLPGTIGHLSQTYPDLWGEETRRANGVLASVVRGLAGSEESARDPAAFLRQARVADRWARREGMELFPAGEKPTLCSFFEKCYRPARLTDASPETVASYRGCLRRWALLTGDPPLERISAEMLVNFRDRLAKAPGRNGKGLSPNTVRTKLRQLLTILGKAGPRGPRNRDAFAILPDPPWCKMPKERFSIPRTASDEQLAAVYRAAGDMTWPEVPGIEPAAWWRALLVTAFATGLRTRAMFSLRWDWVDWDRRWIVVLGSAIKTGRPMIKPLNQSAIDHLRTIYSAGRERVFPLPCRHLSAFHKWFRRLRESAGLTRSEAFGLQIVRKTHGTRLAETDLEAAQASLGHRSLGVTLGYYVDQTRRVGRAVEALPQPAAFLGESGKRASHVEPETKRP